MPQERTWSSIMAFLHEKDAPIPFGPGSYFVNPFSEATWHMQVSLVDCASKQANKHPLEWLKLYQISLWTKGDFSYTIILMASFLLGHLCTAMPFHLSYKPLLSQIIHGFDDCLDIHKKRFVCFPTLETRRRFLEIKFYYSHLFTDVQV